MAGEKIKDRKVKLADGQMKKLSELAGTSGLVLYFYPKDSTPGCTTEACDFRDHSKKLKQLGFQIAGVSPDTESSHQNFIKKQKLNFPLIADTDCNLIESLGLWVEKKLYGRTYMGVARTTFLLDDHLNVLKKYDSVKVKDHASQILKDIKDIHA